MAENGSTASGKGVAVILVAAVLAMVCVFAVFSLSASDHDLRKTSHDYVLEGSHEGVSVTGSGSTHYYDEGGFEYLYELSVNCSDSSRFSVTVILDGDGNLVDAYDTVTRVGTETVDGSESVHWLFTDHWDEEEMTFNIWVGSSNTILQMTASGDGWDVAIYLSDPVSSVSFSEALVQIHVGSSVTLVPVIHPSHASSVSYSWISSDTSVVTVDQNGVLTAVGTAGQDCVVTVTVNGHSATVPVVIVA